MSKPKMPSNTGLFEKLGNPWITERQREKDYPHSLSENPEMDRWTKAGFAKERHDRQDYKPLADPDRLAGRKRAQVVIKAMKAAKSASYRRPWLNKEKGDGT